jgi:hypothetical protein
VAASIDLHLRRFGARAHKGLVELIGLCLLAR